MWKATEMIIIRACHSNFLGECVFLKRETHVLFGPVWMVEERRGVEYTIVSLNSWAPLFWFSKFIYDFKKKIN